MSQFRIFREKFGHSLLQLDELRSVTELRLVLVKIGKQGLRFFDGAGFFYHPLHTILKDNSGICVFY